MKHLQGTLVVELKQPKNGLEALILTQCEVQEQGVSGKRNGKHEWIATKDILVIRSLESA